MRRAVTLWLSLCCALCAAMVVVGGVTRLTGSGLSIVEWAPLSGAIPPLTHDAWVDALARYRATPEGTLVNAGIDLARFQSLFLVEWAHRLLARVFGLTLVVPFIVLLARRALDRRVARSVAIAIGLALVQALVGWLMVKSGLRDVPHVSPYRLALHLMLGFTIFGVLFDAALTHVGAAVVEVGPGLAHASRGVLGVIAVTAVSGAAMAGTRAGLLFATFPHMNGVFVPADVFAHGPRSMFEDPLTAHFDHRLLALVVTVAALAFAALAAQTPLRRRALYLLGAVALQITLGAATVMLHVPLAVAAAHQLGGLIVFAAAVALAHGCRAADYGRGDLVIPAGSGEGFRLQD